MIISLAYIDTHAVLIVHPLSNYPWGLTPMSLKIKTHPAHHRKRICTTGISMKEDAVKVSYHSLSLGDNADAPQKYHPVDSPISYPHTASTHLPPEVWRMVVGLLADRCDPTTASTLASVVRVCGILREEGELALYRHVSVGPSIPQVRTFLDAISRDKRRASTMRSLSLDVPDVAYGGPPLPATVRTLIGDMTRNPRVAPVDRETLEELRAPLENLFRFAVNLVDLDFPALEDFPGMLYAASFRLRALTTTGAGYASFHLWENRSVPSWDSDRYALYTPVEKLRLLRRLDLNLKGIWCSADALHATFRRYDITHLTLRGASGRSAARDLLPLMSHRLVSFRVVLAPGESEFWSAWDLWPTQILGEAKLPILKHLEIDESEYVYQSVSRNNYSDRDTTRH